MQLQKNQPFLILIPARASAFQTFIRCIDLHQNNINILVKVLSATVEYKELRMSATHINQPLPSAFIDD